MEHDGLRWIGETDVVPVWLDLPASSHRRSQPPSQRPYPLSVVTLTAPSQRLTGSVGACDSGGQEGGMNTTPRGCQLLWLCAGVCVCGWCVWNWRRFCGLIFLCLVSAVPNCRSSETDLRAGVVKETERLARWSH